MKNNYDDYKALDRKVDSLYENGDFAEAVALLESSYNRFPDFDYELKTYALYCCRESARYDKCLEILEEGLDKGYFYGLRWEGWDPLRNYPQWESLNRRNEANKMKVQEKSSMEFRVFTPDNYDPEKEYPLFITLHGDGTACNIEDFSKEWKPGALTDRDFIVAYVQSSQCECSNGFGWTSDYVTARSDLKEAYGRIVNEYSVDRDNVLVGGFSGGSMASLNLLMNDTFPIKGIVALCPGETDDCTSENMNDAAKRRASMVLLEGEKSGDVPFHKQLMTWAGETGMNAEYIINKGAGHIVPEYFDEVLIKAVDFIGR